MIDLTTKNAELTAKVESLSIGTVDLNQEHEEEEEEEEEDEEEGEEKKEEEERKVQKGKKEGVNLGEKVLRSSLFFNVHASGVGPSDTIGALCLSTNQSYVLFLFLFSSSFFSSFSLCSPGSN